MPYTPGMASRARCPPPTTIQTPSRAYASPTSRLTPVTSPTTGPVDSTRRGRSGAPTHHQTEHSNQHQTVQPLPRHLPHGRLHHTDYGHIHRCTNPCTYTRP